MPAGSRGACAGLVPSAATVLALPSDKSWPSVSSSAEYTNDQDYDSIILVVAAPLNGAQR